MQGPSFWETVRLLLRVAGRRSTGRRRRQQALLNQKSGKNATDWSVLGTIFTVLLMTFINGAAAFVVDQAVASGERLEVERDGKMVVSQLFLDATKVVESAPPERFADPDGPIPSVLYKSEAKRISERSGGSTAEIEIKLRDTFATQGSRGFVSANEVAPGLSGLPQAGRFTGVLGSLALFWWAAMLVFQGEGLELDLQRRRHPMWEWLFSHPAPPGAIFLAEMLSPLAANPIYWGGPLFSGFLFGLVYGTGLGFLAALAIGVPITIALACLGKALEIAVLLRCPPRTRGAVVGIMSWLGYASMMTFLLGLAILPKVITTTWRFFNLFTVLPWPWLRLCLGVAPDGSFSFVLGLATCWILAASLIAASVWFSAWATNQGLSGNLAAADAGPSGPKRGGVQFGREPLYRKELLWFRRDRSAIVQTILIPLTVASVQAFNLRGLLSHAQGAWNYLCGTAIVVGTYFLWILGPKSLASEGSALWMALTWPRGLESLLKAKAWLWSLISAGIVALVLGYAAFLFPHDIGKIALVGVGWWFFGRSMAEKAVTLVTVTSESGEVQKIPSGLRWGASLGMLTFAIGVMTENWPIAVMGIVYSYLTAAAMWQNFRHRLPFLYDPWSEVLPPAPTLMHAMVAIQAMVELGAILTGILLVVAGRDFLGISQAFSYGLCSVVVAMVLVNFLGNRGVRARDIWCWPAGRSETSDADKGLRKFGFGEAGFLAKLMLGVGGGLLLGLIGQGYMLLLHRIPTAAEMIRKSQEQMATIPNLRVSYAVMAVCFAPFAEEYLFRGMLYRALDREWGGWRAVVGSAAFFTIFHPPLAWLPVFLVGVANAMLFKKTGRLAPAVMLHMAYNAVVVAWWQ